MTAKRGSRVPFGVLVAGALLILIGVVLYLLRDRAAAPVAMPEVESRAEIRTASIPRSTPPPAGVGSSQPALPLPALDASDPELAGSLIELFGQDIVTRFLVSEDIVRKIVVTIDNAAREKMALDQRPLQPTPGIFIVAGPDEALLIAPENYARYAPFIAVVRSVDARRLVAIYRRLQPLFQEAYEDLGYPDASFDDRLRVVIDHLLETPAPPAEIALVQPGVLYRYADGRLESLSSGQKLLIRMGPEAMAEIKLRLSAIRSALF